MWSSAGRISTSHSFEMRGRIDLRSRKDGEQLLVRTYEARRSLRPGQIGSARPSAIFSRGWFALDAQLILANE